MQENGGFIYGFASMSICYKNRGVAKTFGGFHGVQDWGDVCGYFKGVGDGAHCRGIRYFLHLRPKI